MTEGLPPLPPEPGAPARRLRLGAMAAIVAAAILLAANLFGVRALAHHHAVSGSSTCGVVPSDADLPSGWTYTVSAAGRFRVAAPGAAEVGTYAAGQGQRFTFRLASVQYNVFWYDTVATDTAELQAGIYERDLQRSGYRIVDRHDTSEAGLPAVELTFRDGTAQYRNRTVVFRERVYNVGTGVPLGGVDEYRDEVEAFLDSFSPTGCPGPSA